MGKIELWVDRERQLVGDLTTNHATSSYGQAVLVITEGGLGNAGPGAALGQGDIPESAELRVRDPADEEHVKSWLAALPSLPGLTVAHGGPRGGGRPREWADPVTKKVTFERRDWKGLMGQPESAGKTLQKLIAKARGDE